MRFDYLERTHCACGERLQSAAPSVRRVWSWGPVNFTGCLACGSWCQAPQIDPAALARWYDSDEYRGSALRQGAAYSNYLADEPSRLNEARHRFARDLSAWLPRGSRVLEVGCATGSLLHVLAGAGCQVEGMDLSGRFVEFARRTYGLDVTLGDAAAIDRPDGGFDAILLFGTFSNLSNLDLTLARFRRWLRPGGAMVINVPIADSVVARLHGRRYWMFAPTVVTFFTRRGCRLVLERAGFTALTTRCDWQRPSLRKLVTHVGARRLVPWLERAGVAAAILSMPVPGVELIRASCRTAASS